MADEEGIPQERLALALKGGGWSPWKDAMHRALGYTEKLSRWLEERWPDAGSAVLWPCRVFEQRVTQE